MFCTGIKGVAFGIDEEEQNGDGISRDLCFISI